MMADPPFRPRDERPHPPDPVPDWEESWYFDFVDDDGRLAGYARLGLRPAERTAWWWSAVVGDDLPYVLVRDHEVELPRRSGTQPGGDALEIRAPGLWAEPVCETPFEHWSLGLEAMAVGLDDPVEAYGAERGEPVPLGFDLEWEMDAGPTAADVGQGYAQPARVSGDVLVGARRLSVTGAGRREHRWGGRDWSVATGTDLELDERGLLVGAVYHAPVQVPGVSRVARAVVARDAGWAWVERVSPLPASPSAPPRSS